MTTYTRNSVSLNTVGNGEDGQYYDQICGMAQKTINAAFDSLFAQRKEVRELIYNNGFWEDGNLFASMDAPRVILRMEGGAQAPLYFMIRIRTGHISFSGSDPMAMQKLDGWTIAVPATLNQANISPGPSNPTKQAAQAAKALNEVQKSFNLHDPARLQAGEYSIHRLFATISENQWREPDENVSIAYDEVSKTHMSLKQWLQTDKGKALGSQLTGCLRRWAADHQSSAFFTLGLQLRLPKASEQPLTPTYAPVALRVQNYPYLTDEEQRNLRQQNLPLIGTEGKDRDYNCFVYCETVATEKAKNRPLPGTPYLAYTGNLAAPAAGSQEEILGTFVLSRQLFFEARILPLLQELNLISNIIPIRPEAYVDGDKNAIFRMRLLVGSNPRDNNDFPGLPPQRADDPSLAFKYVGPGEYSWSSKYKSPGSDTDLKPYNGCKQWPFYRKWTTTADNSVKVTWKVGDDTFKVSGQNTVYHWEGYNGSESFGWGPGGGALWGTFTLTSSWSFEIDLNVTPENKKNPNIPNGCIEPKIIGLNKDGIPANYDANFRVSQDYFRDRTPWEVGDEIKKSLEDSLKRINSNLMKSSLAAGTFNYPGTGSIDFGPPTIGDHGDILSSIRYLPLDGGRVDLIAPQPEEIKNPKERKDREIVAPPTIPQSPTHLTWKPYFKQYNPESGRLILNLKAENTNLASPVAFDMVKISPLKSIPMGKIALYNAQSYSWVSAKKANLPPANPPAGNPPAGNPPAGNPPAGNPPAGNPPAGNPPAGSPPAGGASGCDGGEWGMSSTTDGPVATTDSTNPPAVSTSTTNKEQDLGYSKTTSNIDSTANATMAPKPADSVTLNATPTTTAPAGGATNPTTTTTAPAPPKPQNSWDLTKKAIPSELSFRVSTDAATPVFSVYCETQDAEENTVRSRFIMPTNSSFELELDGKTDKQGDYVVELNEIQNSTDFTQDFGGKQTASTYLMVSLKGTDHVEFKTLTLEEANKLRGV